MTKAFDVIVIGMGVAGEAVAGGLAEAGLKVLGVDEKLVGGECPYWGCIPSKMAIRGANLLAEARRVEGMSGAASVQPDWAPVARRIRDEATDNWDDRVAVERFESKGGTFVRNHARLTAPGEVEVGGTTYRASRAVVVATGANPAVPPIPGLGEVPYWTNRELVEALTLPASMLVLGGGAIGAELAQAVSRFGVEVSIVEAADRLLVSDSPAVGRLLAEVFDAEGIAVHTGVSATSVRATGSLVEMQLDDGQTIRAERLLVATGRRVDLRNLGLENVGLDPEAESLTVDECLRVAPGLWAVGDVTGRGAFTHVATYQASIAVADILGQPHHPADYRALPRVTFTDPEVGSVGLTAVAARDAGLDVAVGTTDTPSTARGWLHKAGNEGLIEVVADRGRGVLVGATAVGPAGGEVLGLLTLAVHAEVPIETLRRMIYAYPTFHRGVEDALRDLDA